MVLSSVDEASSVLFGYDDVAGWPPDGPNSFDSVRQIVYQLRRKFAGATQRASRAGKRPPEKLIGTHAGRFEPGTYELLLRPFEVGLPE